MRPYDATTFPEHMFFIGKFRREPKWPLGKHKARRDSVQ